ncbi:MAG: outer membrane protein assembly factor BamE [Cereibacter changlensis]
MGGAGGFKTVALVRSAGFTAVARRGLRQAALGLCLVAVVACAPVYRNHGYAPEDTALAQITVGKDTRDTVAEIVGRPSAAGLLNDEGWYYVQSRYRHFGARRPEEIERQVVAISFTPNGTVENVERFGLEQGKVVPLSRRVTESNIKGVSLIGQLLGNIGQFRADQFIPQEER